MKLLCPDEFLKRVQEQGVRLDTQYSPPQCLAFSDGLDLRVDLPRDIHKRAGLVRQLLSMIPSDAEVCVWKRQPVWSYVCPSVSARSPRPLMVALMNALAVHGEGGIVFEASEHNVVELVCFLQSLCADHVADDLFVIPSGTDFFFYFSHDDDVFVECRDSDALKSVEERVRGWTASAAPERGAN